jgi:hypothetical protein
VANNTNLIERFHGTLKDRTKIMRGLKDIETISQANAVSATRIPELPEGIKYMILRKRIIKRPRRKKQAEKREIQPVLVGVKV